MWPFSEMSLSVATLAGTVANWMLLLSLVGGVISTFVIVKTTDVKEEYWAEDRRQSAEKIATLNNDTERLRADAEVAKVEIAKANERAEADRLSRLKLEEKLAPRTLSAPQQAAITNALSSYKDTSLDIFIYGGGSADALPLAGMISEALGHAGWKVRVWNTIAPGRWVRGILIQTLRVSDQSVENPAVALILTLRTVFGSGVSGHEQFIPSKDPPEGGLMGPPWEGDKQAPVRMLLGSKP